MGRSGLSRSVKRFDRSVNIALQIFFLSHVNRSFSVMERNIFRVLKTLRNPHWYLQNLLLKKIIDLIIQTPLANFWNIWKNTDRPVVTFLQSVRKENYWIETLRICYPYDLNESKKKADPNVPVTEQKIKFSIKDFFGKCDQILSFLQIWSHLLKSSLLENFIFCIVSWMFPPFPRLWKRSAWCRNNVNIYNLKNMECISHCSKLYYKRY